jgi:hypothetical protein
MLFMAVASLLALAAAAPVLIRLGNSIVLPVVVIGAVVILVRLAFFHTRRF